MKYPKLTIEEPKNTFDTFDDTPEFKEYRHRFWRTGRPRRMKILIGMGYGQKEKLDPFIEPIIDTKTGKPIVKNGIIQMQTLESERVQRRVLVHIYSTDRTAEFLTLLEVQEAEVIKEEKEGEGLRMPAIGMEIAPSKEELAQMKYVPGIKKDIGG